MRCLDAQSAVNDGRVSTSTAAMRCQQSIRRNNDMPRCTYLASTGEKAGEVGEKGKEKIEGLEEARSMKEKKHFVKK